MVSNKAKWDQTVYTKKFRLRFHLASGNKYLVFSESRKALVIQRFSGFFFFSGYKLATFAAIFVARGSRHNAVKLSGYLHLLVGVQVTVRVHRCLYLFMSEPLRDQQRREAHLHQQAGVAVPLRYNYDKPEKPRISRDFGYLARFFILFQTEKSSREVMIF